MSEPMTIKEIVAKLQIDLRGAEAQIAEHAAQLAETRERAAFIRGQISAFSMLAVNEPAGGEDQART